ncbi:MULTISPECIES: AlpA family transcriptional regulator [Hafnia]|jgi:predicted DNA-binding transcriptional regulator AlpA|uniref:helix-turn-helix transcriptional regulator n=1 Tax=Hafnia TaxID=568 RepID=UPI000907D63E|nr:MULTISPECIES: AlpA family phage regulatory protein [Hafnia]KAA0261774.1 AlpA family phage regulatory protein [Hafnia alvei]TBL55342.1 AlpA family phage regulatory protein [Hafnia paralvei]
MKNANHTHGIIPITGFIRQKNLMQCLPFSSATLWRRVAAGTFPKPLKISPKITAWRAEEVRQWINDQGSQSL